MCPGTGGVEDFEHFGGFVEQRVLAGKGSVHPPRDVEPLLARFGCEVWAIRDDAERVHLSFSFWDRDNTDHTTGKHFGDGWPTQQNADGCAWTTAGLAPIADDGTIDLDPLHKAAADALSAIGTHLRS